MGVYLYPNNTETELKNAYIWIPNPTSIVLDKGSISLTTVGQTEQLTATIEPTISDHSITWSSDDTSVATVSTTGLVTCVTPWECTITATTVNGLTASCGVGQWRLPSAYQEVEWIQSSWTQYINTGYTPLTTTEFDLTFEKVSQVSTWDCPFGTRKQYNQQAYYIWYVSSSSYYAFGNNHVDPSSVPFYSTWVKYNITYKNWVLSNGSQTVNVSVNSSPYWNLHLFCDLDNGSISEKSAIKLYSFKLYESGTLVRDFVPCYRIADSVIWLYDLVNDVFYTNNWTWTFTKWPDVN